MAVAVQADDRDVAGAIEAPLRAFQRLVDDARPGFFELDGDEFVVEQVVARLVAESLDVERGPFDEGFERTHRVDAAEKAAHPFEGLGILEFRRPSAAARVHRDAVVAVRVQRRAARERNGRNYGNLPRREFCDELVFFKDLGIGPAARAVELGDEGFFVLDAELVDAVLVAVEGLQAAVRAQPGALQGVEDGVGGQAGVRGRL